VQALIIDFVFIKQIPKGYIFCFFNTVDIFDKEGFKMSNCAVVGINWGDEGKGRMVDLLTRDYDIVVRYQGGGNAGHTVVNEFGKFALHLLPSGIFRKSVVNVLGNGVALDPQNLWSEIAEVQSKGVSLTPDNLKISSRASLLLPWHRDLDALEEKRLKDKKYGSTKQGIAPFYSDKYQKKGSNKFGQKFLFFGISIFIFKIRK